MKKLFKLIKRWFDLSHDQPWRKNENEKEQKETKTPS